MTGIVSVNLKKIKAGTKVNDLIAENYRTKENADHYDNGSRIINTDKTKDNVFLLECPADYDQMRRDRIERINDARAARAKTVRIKGEKEKLRREGKLQATTSKEAATTRKLRTDTVDVIGLVVQPSAEFITALKPEEQTRFFCDSLEVMQKNPEWFGRIETAVIHYDENTPHMQCLASALNEETLTGDCQRIMGNKSKMSDRQTLLANEMRAKGWDIERGLKRVDNPKYKNFKDEMESQGYKINRYNDAKLMQEFEKIKKEKALNSEKEKALNKKVSSLELYEKNLQMRERQVVDQEKANAEEKRRLLSKKKELDKLTTDYNTRIESIIAQIDTLNKRNEELLQREKKVLKMSNMASETQKKNKAESARLVKLQKKLEEQKNVLNEYEKEFEIRKTSLANKEKRIVVKLKDKAYWISIENAKKLEQAETIDNFEKILDDFGDFEEAVNKINDTEDVIAL